jgi:hypothetical protein
VQGPEQGLAAAVTAAPAVGAVLVTTANPNALRDVVEAARRRGEVAVGFRDPGESDEPLGFQLNPAKSTRVRFSEDDRVIVLAEE